MKNITSEKIDEVVGKVFLKVSENFINDFFTNQDKFKEVIDECKKEGDNSDTSYIAADFAAFKTARDNCIEILKESLKELLCD